MSQGDEKAANWKECLQCGELMEGKKGLCESCLAAQSPREAPQGDDLEMRRKNFAARNVVIATFYAIASFLIFYGFNKGYPLREWSTGVLVVTTLLAAAVIFAFGFTDRKARAD